MLAFARDCNIDKEYLKLYYELRIHGHLQFQVDAFENILRMFVSVTF